MKRGPCENGTASNAFENGYSGPICNDVVVAADDNFLLEEIMPSYFHDIGAVFESIDVRIFSADFGTLIYEQAGAPVISQVYQGENYGFDISMLSILIDPVDMPGTSGAETSYWVELSNAVTSGASTFWELESTEVIGQPYYVGAAGAGGIIDDVTDGVFSWAGQCGDGGGGEGGPCENGTASNAFENGYSGPICNDVVVAADDNFLLEEIMPSYFHDIGAVFESIDVRIFSADFSTLIYEQAGAPVISQVYQGENYGFDISMLSILIDPVDMPGTSGAETSYWVELSNAVTSGASTFWELESTEVIGQPYYVGAAGAGGIIDDVTDGVFSWAGQCGDGGGGEGGPCENGTASNEFENGYSGPICNDVVVAADDNFLLEEIMPSYFHDIGAVFESIDVRIFSADFGTLIYEQAGAPVISQEYQGENYGFDISMLSILIDPVDMPGTSGAETSYWVELSNAVTSGASTFWELESTEVIGQPYYVGEAGAGGIIDDVTDGVFSWAGQCGSGGGGGEGGPCENGTASNAFENGYSGPICNDVVVAADDNFLLEEIMPSYFHDIGAVFESIDVRIFSADFGTLIYESLGAPVISQEYQGENYGFDVSMLSILIDPVDMPGTSGAETSYWVELSNAVTSGASTFWELETTEVIGQPYYVGAAGAGGIVDDVTDGVFVWAGQCESGGGGGGENDCGIGNVEPDGEGGNFGVDYLLGVSYTLEEEGTINSINMIGNGSGSLVQMAVYNDLGGVPDDLIVFSEIAEVGNGMTVYPVTPTVIPPGDYWIMAVYEFQGDHSNVLQETGNPVYYTALPFGDPIPTNASDFLSYADRDFLYSLDITCSGGSGGAPANDLCVDATAVQCDGVYAGETATATDTGGNPAPDVWYKYSGAAGDITLSLCDGGTDYDSYLRVYDACDGTEIADNDDSCDLQSELTFAADGTSTYYIMVEGYGDNSGNFSLEVFCELITPANDLCEDAIAVECDGVYAGETATATDTGGNPAPDVWYSYSGAAGDITLSLCDGGTDYDSYLRVYDACDGTEIADNDDSCDLQSELTFAADGTSTYYIMVEGYGDNSGNFSLEVFCELLGTNDNTIEGFSFYPNPATDAINLSSTENIERVTIYNILGQKVIDQDINATSSQLNVSNLVTGAYLMQVSVDGKTATYKVLKN